MNLLGIEEHLGVPRARRDPRCVLIPSKAAGMELEFHQLELRYDRLRIARPDHERRLLSSLAEVGQQVPIVVVKQGVMNTL